MHKPDFFFPGPWISIEQVPNNFWNNLKLKVFATNDRELMKPNIWCLCTDQYQPAVLANSTQHVSFSVRVYNQDVFVSAIYAYTTYLARRLLWQELNNLPQ